MSDETSKPENDPDRSPDPASGAGSGGEADRTSRPGPSEDTAGHQPPDQGLGASGTAGAPGGPPATEGGTTGGAGRQGWESTPRRPGEDTPGHGYQGPGGQQEPSTPQRYTPYGLPYSSSAQHHGGQYQYPGSQYGSTGAHGGSGQSGPFQPVPDGGFGHAPEHHRPTVGGRKNGAGRLAAGVAALALLAGAVGGGVTGWIVSERAGGDSSVSALDQQPPARNASNAPEGSVQQVAEKVLPSVTQLQVRGQGGAGEGSGVVLSSDGLILTNNHVVEPAVQGGQIVVAFANGTTAPAEIIGRDPSSDLAVVKASGVSDLTPAELGRSDDLSVGQDAVAIGSPFGLTGTVTSGIISSLDRPVRAGGEQGTEATVLDAIQTDAAINPGNSGGPLVDMEGRVIGINSAIYSPGAGTGQAGSVGLGFAIPIDQARRIADELRENGVATRAVLGVQLAVESRQNGADVAQVVPGGAAAEAGVEEGDVVIKLNDRVIQSSDALIAAVRSEEPGSTVTLTVRKQGGDEREIQVTLGSETVG
ncbi:S1C family serine protease [Actinoalloteichus spitiensis]|uniref:S1C family serine protease n=1 Tax=Actinoalloteichus spitiensis TaxID=252394 RepID=UPI000A05A102|nr:trypsin-like peptidase domain-containing protein [Actinoalloteichus spitiensis]